MYSQSAFPIILESSSSRHYLHSCNTFGTQVVGNDALAVYDLSQPGSRPVLGRSGVTAVGICGNYFTAKGHGLVNLADMHRGFLLDGNHETHTPNSVPSGRLYTSTAPSECLKTAFSLLMRRLILALMFFLFLDRLLMIQPPPWGFQNSPHQHVHNHRNSSAQSRLQSLKSLSQ